MSVPNSSFEDDGYFCSVAPDWHRPSLLTLHREEERFSIIARISASLTLQQSTSVRILHIDACRLKLRCWADIGLGNFRGSLKPSQV